LRTKKRIISLLVAFSFVLAQVAGLFGTVARAEGKIRVTVSVQSNTGIIASGSSDTLTASLALDKVLKSCSKSSAVIDGGMISSIDGISNAADWSKYWMLAVDRNGTYVDVTEGINTLMLQNGDKLIVYYSAPDTYTANKIEYSTTSPNEKLTITLNNEQQDWNTGKMVTTPLSSATMQASIDGQPVAMDQNTITVENGLSSGRHYLTVSDYQSDASLMPRVVDDTFAFNIEDPICSVRVEGLTDTMVEGSAQGATALEVVKKVLAQKGIAYNTTTSSWGEYISEIGGLKENDVAAGTGWMYYVKNKSAVISPDSGIDTYVPKNGDEIVLYFTDFTVPFVNSITFSPNVVPVNGSFKMKFAYSYTDWSNWANPVTAVENIAGALVTIDGAANYVTDSSGEISIAEGLGAGTHTYRISGYNSGTLSTVVMDEGTFTIDGVNSPSFDLSKTSYDNNIDQNNLLVNKDIDGSISATAPVVKGYSDPWANVSMQKLGMTGNSDYLGQAYADISKNGAAGYSNTELEKLIFGLTANGYSPYSFAGSDLVNELYTRNIDSFLVSDAIYGLMALDYANVPDNYSVNRQVLVNKLLSLKVSDGTNTGWSLSDSMDPDTTGAAICALSPYMDNQQVAEAVNSSVVSLAGKVTESGYVLGHYGISSETNAFVILGLLSVGVNPEGVSTLSDGSTVNFAETSGDLVSGMLSFKTGGGLFRHTKEGKGNAIATEECLRALIALKEFKEFGTASNYYSSKINATELAAYPAPGASTEQPAAGTDNQQTTTTGSTASAGSSQSSGGSTKTSGSSSGSTSTTGGTAASGTDQSTDTAAATEPAAAAAPDTSAATGEQSSASGQTGTQSQSTLKSATDNYMKVGGGLVAMGVLGAAVYLLLGRKDNFR